MSDPVAKGENGGKGERKPRGGKGGEGKGGKGKRERKPREEIPTFDDPEAELKKVSEGKAPDKPNREALDRKIGHIQNDIESNKKRTEAITKELDGIKEKNERAKQQGSGPMEKCRETLRELKKQIVGVIEERKQVSGSIDQLREKKSSMDEAIKKQRASVGRLTSNEAIDEEIRRIEDYMAHNSIGLKEEKSYMIQIKELNKKRDEVKALEMMTGQRSAPGQQALSLPELFDSRKKIDERLDALRDQEKVAVEALNAQREKNQSKESSERFEKLLEERKGIRDKISTKITEIREIRGQYQKEDDKWFEHDRLVKNLKWQIRQKNNKEREARQAEYEADKKKRSEDWEAEKEHRKNFDEDGNPREKFMDFDLAERIAWCEQLIVFLQKFVPQSNENKSEAVAPAADGRKVERESGLKEFAKSDILEDDPLGLNSYMVEEVVSKKDKKRNKKKKSNAAKNDDSALLAEGEVVTVQLSLEMIQQFASMSLPVPTDSDDAPGSIQSLQLKKAYYEEKGEEGLTLKEVLKSEKDARKKGKKAENGKEEPAAEAAPVKESMAAEEGEFDLAALRAKAQASSDNITDEEKKARGLLYDKSKASAVRDDSESEDEEDESADFGGGDPFEGL